MNVFIESMFVRNAWNVGMFVQFGNLDFSNRRHK